MTTLFLPPVRVILIIDLALMLLFCVAMPFVAPDWSGVLVQAARGAMSAMVTIAYGASVWEFRKEQLSTSKHMLVIGIFLAFGADFIGSVLSVVWRYYGKPEDWINYSFWLLPSFMTSIAAMHHIAAPGAINGQIPKRNFMYLSIGFGISGLVAGVFLGMRIGDIWHRS
jgi:uncharacterized membrane protein